MPQLYRFELSFNGEPQNIGIFTGIPEAGIPQKTSDKLLAQFNELLIPELNNFKAQFWFTEYGLREFLPAIVKFRNAFQKRGWQITYRAIPDDSDTRQHAIYEDTYQIALTEAPNAKQQKFDIKKLKNLITKKGTSQNA